jgi:hypothetical protein
LPGRSTPVAQIISAELIIWVVFDIKSGDNIVCAEEFSLSKTSIAPGMALYTKLSGKG